MSANSSTPRWQGCCWRRASENGQHGRILEALDLLDRLLSAATEGGRTGSVIDILVAHALAHHAAGDPTTALASLERAIALAEPEGYVRIFVDEGEPMEALLKLAAKQRACAGATCPGSWLPSALVPSGSADAPGPDRAAERARARGPPPPGERARWPGHRARAGRVAEHGADAHEEHLRQARREQPARRRPPRRRARAPVADAALAARPGSPLVAATSAPGAPVCSSRRRITTSLTTSGDARSPPRFSPWAPADQVGTAGRRPRWEHARGGT